MKAGFLLVLMLTIFNSFWGILYIVFTSWMRNLIEIGLHTSLQVKGRPCHAMTKFSLKMLGKQELYAI